MGERTVKVISTPGHTPGSICLLDDKTKFLFAGDTLDTRAVLLHLDYSSSPETYLDSLNKLKSLSSEFSDIYPAHHVSPLGKEIIDDYIEITKGAIDKTLPVEKRKDSGLEGLRVKYKNISLLFKEKY